MNPKYFGDSFDIVKRFIFSELKHIGYKIVIDPMYTDTWNGNEKQFYKFVGATPVSSHQKNLKRTVLYFDPDTGVREKTSPKHITFRQIISNLEFFAIVISFDQSFSRNNNNEISMLAKLEIFEQQGYHCFYYNSHAKFLFTSKHVKEINRIKRHLIKIGIPKERLVSRF